MENLNLKWVRPTIYIISVLLLLIFTFKIMIFLLPFVMATLIVMIVNPIYNFIVSNTKIKSKYLKTLILLLIYILIAFIVGYFFIKIILEGYVFTKFLFNNKDIVISKIDYIYSIFHKYVEILPTYTISAINSAIDSIYNLVTRIVSIYSVAVFSTSFDLLKSLPNILVFVFTTIIASFIILKDKEEINAFINKQFPAIWIEMFYKIRKDAIVVLFVYLRAQAILILICFVELVLGFSIISKLTGSIDFPIFYAFMTAIIEALPILGAGTVLIPWIVISLIFKNFYLALLLLVLYGIITVVRQSIEPRLMNKGTGMHPLATLIALYSGYKIFGVLGFLYGPVIMSIINVVFYEQLNQGFFKFIVSGGERKDEETN